MKIEDCLPDLFSYDDKVCLDMYEYHPPNVYFVDDFPDKRKETKVPVSEVFESFESFDSIWKQICTCGSVYITGTLKDKQVRFLNDLYGFGCESVTKKKGFSGEKLNWVLPIGLVTVDSYQVKDSHRIGELTASLTDFVSNVMTYEKKGRLGQVRQVINQDSKYIFPTLALHGINGEESMMPFLNMNLYHGGLIGLYRLECGLEKNFGKKISADYDRKRAKQHILESIRDLKKHINYFADFLKIDDYQFLLKQIEETYRYYA